MTCEFNSWARPNNVPLQGPKFKTIEHCSKYEQTTTLVTSGLRLLSLGQWVCVHNLQFLKVTGTSSGSPVGRLAH